MTFLSREERPTHNVNAKVWSGKRTSLAAAGLGCAILITAACGTESFAPPIEDPIETSTPTANAGEPRIGAEAVPLNECTDNPCDPIVSCTASLTGLPTCGECPAGFTGDGAELCVFSMNAVGSAIASRDQYFVTANDESFMQQTSTFQMRNVWVSVEAVDAYQAIDPENLEQQIDAFPVGTMFMHEPVNGPPFGGVMVKREPGYDPELNDWWFGRFNRFNLGYIEETNPRMPGYSGQSCLDCHITDGRPERTDLLWGIPRAALPDDVVQ